MEVRTLLEGEMKRRGWNQSALARFLGVKQQLVSRWLDEENPTRPSVDSCCSIADSLDMPVDVILRMAGYPVAEIEAQPSTDLEWDLVQRELKAIFESFDRSKWADLTATVRAVSSLVAVSPKEVAGPSPKSEASGADTGESVKEHPTEAVNYRGVKELVGAGARGW